MTQLQQPFRPKVMVIFGTRPEAVKMAPIVNALKQRPDCLEACIVVTAQHREMLDQVLDIFEIEPDHDLNLMKAGQTLTSITIGALQGLEQLMVQEKPDFVLVQGDTTTAYVGGLAAFYQQIPVGHVEAGLRTGNLLNPFPEEANRRMLSVLASRHYAPTKTAEAALLAENIDPAIVDVTGNTVIDALLTTVNRQHTYVEPALREIDFDAYKHTVLVTAHRRENLGKPLEQICLGIRDLLEARPNMQVVFPVHLNPKVQKTVRHYLGALPNARLIPPLQYVDFVHVMRQADLVLTDSGGIQEEAPSLGVPVLVMRETSERPEAITAGVARLVGTDRDHIFAQVTSLLNDPNAYQAMQRAINPYGDGKAATRIVNSIIGYFELASDGEQMPLAI